MIDLTWPTCPACGAEAERYERDRKTDKGILEFAQWVCGCRMYKPRGFRDAHWQVVQGCVRTTCNAINDRASDD